MDVKGPAKENQDFEFSAYLFSVGPDFFKNMPIIYFLLENPQEG